jgi:tetratricopeptide (TPR) repeat protein
MPGRLERPHPVIFKHRQDFPADAGKVSGEFRGAKEVQARAAAALRRGSTGEALSLLDGLLGGWQRDAIAARSVEAEAFAGALTLRAIALDRAGRPEEAATACGEALAWVLGHEADSVEARRRIDILLTLRINALESVGIEDAEFVRVLEESLRLSDDLPMNTARVLKWFAWNQKLIRRCFACGDADDAREHVRRVIVALPTLGISPLPSFEVAQAAAIFVGIAVTVAKAGDTDLATEFADRCATLLSDVSSLDVSDSQRLELAERLGIDGMALDHLLLGDCGLRFLRLAAAEYHLGDVQGARSEVKGAYGQCLNGLAWAYARRGQADSALPIALEAVDVGRSGEREGIGSFGLANSLDTLATAYALCGDTDAALSAAHESRTIALRLAKTGDEAGQNLSKRVATLIGMLERGECANFIERE